MSRWSSSDFIVYGTYCDTDTIRKELRRLQRRYKAESAVLLFAQQQTLFGSLMLVTDRNPAREKELQAALRSDIQADMQTDPLFVLPWIPLSRAERTTPRRLRADTQEHERRVWDTMRSREPLRRLFSKFSASHCCTTISKTELLPYFSGSGPIDDPDAEITATLIVAFVNARDKRRHSRSQLADLFAMIQASAPVRVNRDLRGMGAADRCIDRSEFQFDLREIGTPDWAIEDVGRIVDAQSGTPDQTARVVGRSNQSTEAQLKQIAGALLEAAAKLTGTSVGNVYLATGGQLHLAAKIGETNPPKVIDVDAEITDMTWVYKRGKPLVINDIEDFTRTHPTINCRWARPADRPAWAQLTFPIRKRQFLSDRYNVLGVINVQKVDPSDTGLFTSQDLAVLRNIALRFWLWRSQLLFLASSRSLAHLTQRNVATQRKRKGNVEAAPPDLERGVTIPEDLLDARDGVSAILRDVHELTRSLSATVRVLTADTLNLIRFCAFPADALSDKDSVIRRNALDSINAWVATHGQVCYVRNFKELKNPHWSSRFSGLKGRRCVRSGVLSELCIPIFVNHRVVGTLNLESTYQDGYSETIEFARAIAEQVGLSFLQTRRLVENVIWSVTTNPTINGHQILQCVSKLREIARGDGVDAQPLSEIADSIQRSVEGAEGPSPPEPASALEIMMGLLDEFPNYANRVEWGMRPDPDLRHPPLVALAFRLAMIMVLENAYREAWRERSMVRLHSYNRAVGGRRFLSIQVENNLRRPLPPEDARRLYRVPLSGTDRRVHLGAFVAGAAMRGIGGDVYLSRNSESVLSATIDIPLEGLV
jgi:GAF domain-containing protein